MIPGSTLLIVRSLLISVWSLFRPVYTHCPWLSLAFMEVILFLSEGFMEKSHVTSQPCNSRLPWPGFFTTYQKMGFLSFDHLCTGEPIRMNFPSWSLTLLEILIYPQIPLVSFYCHNIRALHSHHAFTYYSQVVGSSLLFLIGLLPAFKRNFFSVIEYLYRHDLSCLLLNSFCYLSLQGYTAPAEWHCTLDLFCKGCLSKF